MRWERASTALKLTSDDYEGDVFKDNIDFEDVGQKGLGDCYFQASLSALAYVPSRIKKLFISDQVSQFGVYCIVLHINGEQ